MNKTYIMGVDEVGVGCLAGPTYICAFKAPREWFMKGVRDSKKIKSEKKREEFSRLLHEDQSIYGFSIQCGLVDDIDYLGIKGTILDCYHKAVMELGTEDTQVIVDGNRFKEDRYEYDALVGGDDLIPHISAASILAKVARDNLMIREAVKYPKYNWAKNKGYGSPEHLAAIKEFGPTPLHRKSFEPVKSMVGGR